MRSGSIQQPSEFWFHTPDAEGRILTRDWSKYDGKKHVVFQPALMSPEELLNGTERAARQFYSIRSIVERLGKSRTGLWWNVVRNMGYHLALRKFGDIGYSPDVGVPKTHLELAGQMAATEA